MELYFLFYKYEHNFLQVFGPIVASTDKLFFSWNKITIEWVAGPNNESTAIEFPYPVLDLYTFKSICAALTGLPLVVWLYPT